MNNKIILTIVGGVILIGSFFTYWLGQQPKITRYQNEQIKTITPRDFFKEVGEAKFYDENGRLIQKYNVINGVKEGHSVVYFNEGEIEFDYVDDKISGKVNINADEEIPEFQNLSIKATEGVFRIKKKSEDKTISSLASITCDNEQFVSVLKNYADKRDKDSLTELMRCLQFDNIKFDDKCVINGSFKYPSFTDGTKISCENVVLDVSDDIYRLTIKDSRHGKYAANAEISARRACPDEKIAEFFMTLNDQKNASASSEFISDIKDFLVIKDFLGCFNFEKIKFKSNELRCVFQGGFKCPNFTQNSRLVCETDTEVFKELSGLPEDEDKILKSFLGEIMDAKKMRYTMDYSVKNGTIVYTTETDNKSLSSTVITSGWDKIIPETFDTAFTAAKRAVESYAGDMDEFDVSDIHHDEALDDISKIFDVIFKNLSLTGESSVVNGKKTSEFKGNLNFFNGFSGTYISNIYVNDNSAIQLSIKDSGSLILRVNYPLSGKPFVAVGIKFRDGLRDKYKNLSQFLWQFIQKSAARRHEASEMSSELLEKYGDLMFNAVDSVSVILTDKKGQKVLSGVMKMKQDLNYKDIVEGKMEPTDIFAFKINLYENNKVKDVIKSIGSNKLEVNGKALPYQAQMLPQIIDNIIDVRLEDFGEEIEKEFDRAAEQFKQGKLKISAGGVGAIGGVLSVGAIAGYSKAMSKYRTNKMIDQATMLITNIRTMFALQRSYAGLNNASAVNMALVPEEMIVNPATEMEDDATRKLRNVFSGDVVIDSSPIDSDDARTKESAFKISFYGISRDACIQVATSDWGAGSSSGLIGMHIWNAENDDTTEPDYDMDNTYSKSHISNNEYFLTPSSVPLSVADAVGACSCTGKNTCAITWKYY